MTYESFYDNIDDLSLIYPLRDLKEYLLALLALTEKHHQSPFSLDLLLDLIQKAFTEAPCPLQEQWLSINTPPESDFVTKYIAFPMPFDTDKQEKGTFLSGYAYTKAVLTFQIAQLHKIETQPNPETDFLWQNTDPFSVLEGGTRGIGDVLEGNETDFTPDWQLLGDILEMGRVYE